MGNSGNVGESEHGYQTGIYVNKAKWFRWTKLLKEKEGVPASQKIREFVDADIARLEGAPAQVAPPDYISAQKTYQRLVKEIEKIRIQLKKAKVYDKLSAMAKKHGLDFNTCRNVDDVAPKVLEEWVRTPDNRPEMGHLFVILMQKNKEERKLESVLVELCKKTSTSDQTQEIPA